MVECILLIQKLNSISNDKQHTIAGIESRDHGGNQDSSDQLVANMLVATRCSRLLQSWLRATFESAMTQKKAQAVPFEVRPGSCGNLPLITTQSQKICNVLLNTTYKLIKHTPKTPLTTIDWCAKKRKKKIQKFIQNTKTKFLMCQKSKFLKKNAQ